MHTLHGCAESKGAPADVGPPDGWRERARPHAGGRGGGGAPACPGGSPAPPPPDTPPAPPPPRPDPPCPGPDPHPAERVRTRRQCDS